jgi:hypothetical protein
VWWRLFVSVGAAEGWLADLCEAGGGEDADVAAVQFAPGGALLQDPDGNLVEIAAKVA